MGGKGSKKPKENQISEPEPTHQLESQLPSKQQRQNQLQNPYNDRPIELSWLQQNNSNNNYTRMHHYHDHIDHAEHLRRIPLAINRWPQDNDQMNERKGKSFTEEYIQQ